MWRRSSFGRSGFLADTERNGRTVIGKRRRMIMIIIMIVVIVVVGRTECFLRRQERKRVVGNIHCGERERNEMKKKKII
jgi:hypothetical protein